MSNLILKPLSVGQLFQMQDGERELVIRGLKPRVRLRLTHLASLALTRELRKVEEYRLLVQQLSDLP